MDLLSPRLESRLFTDLLDKMLARLYLSFVQAAKGRATAQAATQATLGVTATAAVSAGLGLSSSAVTWARSICSSVASCAEGSYSKDNFPDAGTVARCDWQIIGDSK